MTWREGGMEQRETIEFLRKQRDPIGCWWHPSPSPLPGDMCGVFESFEAFYDFLETHKGRRPER